MDPTRLPDAVRGHLETFRAEGRAVAEPRHAASIVLVRDGEPAPGGLEVFLLHRHAGMAFAASVAVFPGGGVDARDREATADVWAGPPAEDWAKELDTDPDVARAVVCAAVRELFEESGVLLAGPDDDTLVPDTAGEDWERDRVRLESRDVSLSELLVERGLRLRTDLLRAWSSWLTPEFEPRRYRTWFFVAALPAGQVTRDVSGEASGVEWTPVASALAAAEAGTVALLPPQLCTIAELHTHGTADALRAAAADRTPSTIAPRAVLDDGAPRLELPPDLVTLVRTLTTPRERNSRL